MMLSICKTKYSSKDCNRCLFVVSKIDILWSSWRTASSLNINFEQVIKPFLVLNIYFTFFLSVADSTFYKSVINSNCTLLLCHVRVRSSSQEVFCKKGVLRNFAKFTGKHPNNFLIKLQASFFLQNTYGGCFWRFRVNLDSIGLELLAWNRRNIWILSEK